MFKSRCAMSSSDKITHIVQRIMEERFQETLQRNGSEKTNNFDYRNMAFILILDVLCDTRKMEARDEATGWTYGGSIRDRGKLICSSSNTLVRF
jgi:hypothetical protein